MNPSLRRVAPKDVVTDHAEHELSDVWVAERAVAAHEREHDRWQNPMGRTYAKRLFGFITQSTFPKITEMTWMPTKDCYERLVGIWAAMSVYGGLIGVAAFSYGMPTDDVDERSMLHNISSATMLTSSILFLVPICQMTVMTVFLAQTPEHKVRAVILENSTMISIAGPMHLMGTLVFFIGIVLRILALEMRTSLRLVYMVPLLVAFMLTWGWTLHALAVGSDWGLHKKAWQEVVRSR
mmetsp:Transcript_22076/g.56375  ORF Transcript_22076/g.56375 Transcript_22076/m.56375 type:complete len:238 (+) Transcript_22076:61-774(+)